MRKREMQAKTYFDNGEILKNDILKKVIDTTTEAQDFLNQAYQDAKNDYFTNKLNESNEQVEEDVEKIKKKIDAVAEDLAREATRLDDEEELLKAREGNPEKTNDEIETN